MRRTVHARTRIASHDGHTARTVLDAGKDEEELLPFREASPPVIAQEASIGNRQRRPERRVGKRILSAAFAEPAPAPAPP